MIVRRFLLWARTAPPGHRAEAVGALARAFLYSDLSPEDRREAETALTAMLDDPSALVRRALAEALAGAPDAPRHVVVGLANDQSDIAALVLARSPLLSDGDLVDCAALGCELVQTAIAMRAHLSSSVAAALAEIACPAALVTLAQNDGAQIAGFSFARMAERFASHGLVREAMLMRPDLPIGVRQALVTALSERLSAFVAESGWMTPERSRRITLEARERATVSLSSLGTGSDLRQLVAHLRINAQLTPALILRALLCGNVAFGEAAFIELTGLSAHKVCGILHDRRSAGFRALYRRAGMPDSLAPAFAAAFAGTRHCGFRPGMTGDQLSRAMIGHVLDACSVLPEEEQGRVMALLRRYDVEAAREEARELAAALAEDAADEARRLAYAEEDAPALLTPDLSEQLLAA